MNDNQGIVSGSRGRKPQVCMGLCFTSLTSQEISDGREARLGGRALSEKLAETFPSELQVQLH